MSNSWEQNRALEEPQTARKEFPVELNHAPKQKRHQQHQQQRTQQEDRQQDWRSHSPTNREPAVDAIPGASELPLFGPEAGTSMEDSKKLQELGKRKAMDEIDLYLADKGASKKAYLSKLKERVLQEVQDEETETERAIRENDQPFSSSEWGDEDFDMESLDEAQFTTQQQWNVDENDIEAMMDDDLDELLASQPQVMKIPEEEQSSPDTGQVAVCKEQWMARISQQEKSATQHSSHGAINLHASFTDTQNNQYNIDITCSNQPSRSIKNNTSHTSKDNTSHRHQLTSHISPQNHHQSAVLANPPSHQPATHHMPQVPKPSHKLSLCKGETSSGVMSSHMASGSSATVHTNFNMSRPKHEPHQERTIHETLDLHSLPFTYLVKVRESWPPSRHTLVTVKAYVATVLGKLESNDGRNWSLHARINDGSASMDVILSDEILTSLIGFSAQEYMTHRSQCKQKKEIKHRLMSGIKSCQESLINMSAILEVELDPKQTEPIVLRHRQVTPVDCDALRERNGL